MANRSRTATRFAHLLPLILTFVAYGCAISDSGDYLSADLRQRVEALKLEAPESTDDVAVLSDRLETLWQWANAYSLTGGPIPDAFSTTRRQRESHAAGDRGRCRGPG